MARDVFISYKEEDRSAATKICGQLERENVSCWMAPRDIPPGKDWPTAIVEGLQRCRFFLVILSANSREARQISREVELADRQGLPIITFRIENVQPPHALQYFLDGVQWLDGFNGQFDSAVARLTTELRRSDGHSAEQAETEPALCQPALRPASEAPSQWKKSSVGLLLVAATLLGAIAFGDLYRSETNIRRVAQAQREFQTGRRYYERGDLEHALAKFNSAIRVNSGCYLAYSYRAMLFHDLGENRRALDDVDAAIRLNPKWPVAFRVKGDVETALKQYHPAIEDYTSAIGIDSPDSRGISNVVLAYRGRAQAHRGLHELEAAKEDEAKVHAFLPQETPEAIAEVVARN